MILKLQKMVLYMHYLQGKIYRSIDFGETWSINSLGEMALPRSSFGLRTQDTHAVLEDQRKSHLMTIDGATWALCGK